jgi:hypothetical protein
MGTSNDVHHILTLRLPGNVERIINDLRSEMYRRSGAASTQGIPSVIPLAYVSPNTRRDLVDNLPQTEIPPLWIGSIEAHGDTLVVAVEMDDPWSEWLNGIAAEPAPPGMPVPFSGVFLGGPDLLERSSGAPILSDWLSSAVPAGRMPKRLAVLSVELIRLETGPATTWWTHLDWEVLWSKRIKLHG